MMITAVTLTITSTLALTWAIFRAKAKMRDAGSQEKINPNVALILILFQALILFSVLGAITPPMALFTALGLSAVTTNAVWHLHRGTKHLVVA